MPCAWCLEREKNVRDDDKPSRAIRVLRQEYAEAGRGEQVTAAGTQAVGAGPPQAPPTSGRAAGPSHLPPPSLTACHTSSADNATPLPGRGAPFYVRSQSRRRPTHLPRENCHRHQQTSSWRAAAAPGRPDGRTVGLAPQRRSRQPPLVASPRRHRDWHQECPPPPTGPGAIPPLPQALVPLPGATRQMTTRKIGRRDVRAPPSRPPSGRAAARPRRRHAAAPPQNCMTSRLTTPSHHCRLCEGGRGGCAGER